MCRRGRQGKASQASELASAGIERVPPSSPAMSLSATAMIRRRRTPYHRQQRRQIAADLTIAPGLLCPRSSIPAVDGGSVTAAGSARSHLRLLSSVAKSVRSSSTETTRPAISPQNAAPTFNSGTSATVTRNATSAPSEKLLGERRDEGGLQHAQHRKARERRDEGFRRVEQQPREGRRKQPEQDREQADHDAGGVLAFALAAADEDGVGRPGEAGR